MTSTRPIRLAHLFSSDLALPGVKPYLAPALERGWGVTLMCPPGPLVEEVCTENIAWSPLEFTRRIDLAGDARASLDLLRTLSSERFDIVHTHNAKVGLAGRVLARLARAPIILHTVHGSTWSLETPEPRRSANALLERVAGLCADMVLTQSVEDFDSYVQMRVVPRRKIRIIGNGVNLSRFDPGRVPSSVRLAERSTLGLRDEEILVVFAGRIVREKGVEEIYAAAEGLLADGIRIAMAGRDDVDRGDSPSAEARMAATRGRVLMLGERSDMHNVYAASDIVGLASWREGMPRVLIEGAAMGKPLVATNVRGCREVVVAGRTGLLCEAKQPLSLQAALRSLAKSPDLRARMGAEARRDALERFDLDQAVRRVYAAYDDCLARR